MLVRLIAALVVIMCTPAGVCAGDFLPPVVTVRRLSAAEMAGGIAKVIWARPPSAARFVSLRGKMLPTQQTEVRLAYDDKNLYVAFKCFESQMSKLVAKLTKRDDPVWRDDSVTVLIDPSGKGNGYFQLVANTIGAKYDEKDEITKSSKWNGSWSTVIKKQAKTWTSLVTIPFVSLGRAAPRLGETWTANFGRKDVTSNETTSWAPVTSSYIEPENWGSLVFGDAAVPIISVVPPRIAASGSYPLEVTVSNATSKLYKLRVETIIDDLVVERLQLPGAASGMSVIKSRFDCPTEGKKWLSIAVYSSVTDKLLARTSAMYLDIPMNMARIAEFRNMLSVQTPLTQAATDQKTAVLKTLDELNEKAEEASGNEAKWAAIGTKLDALEKTIERVRCMCHDNDGRGYVVGTEIALRKILRDKAFGGILGEPARVCVARNEFESSQVVVLAYGKALKDVTVSVSEMKGPMDARISSDRIGLNLVDWVQTRKPKYEIDYVGWYPDPLLEMTPFDVAEGGMRPIWVTVHPPDGVPGGVYRGEIRIKPANAAEMVMPLEVRVWDFTLPTQMHMKTAFAWFEHEFKAWYKRSATAQERRQHYEFLLDHRLSPTNIYTKEPMPAMEDIPYCVERGMNQFCLAYTHNKRDEKRAELAPMLREHEKYLKEKGWWDRAYIYGFDEIREGDYPELRDMFGWVKRQFPDLPRMCTVVPNKDLKGYVDIWVPLTANWVQKDAEDYTNDGDQVWWYVCCTPLHPYPNFFTDYPAIDPRILFWMNWKYKVPGFLYYALNLWGSNRKGDARWPEVPWNTHSFEDFNGDGMLVYPGPNGRLLSSIRLDSIRDGIEDYEYFYILNELVEKAEKSSLADKALIAKARKVLTVGDELVKSPKQYTLDPGLLMNARAEVAELIEKLSKVK